ncbi:MAG: hypothetical protein AB1696_07310 [Planctomycetota bacterium]
MLNAGDLNMAAAPILAGNTLTVDNDVWGTINLGANNMDGRIIIGDNLVYDADNESNGWIYSTGRIANFVAGVSGIQVQGLAGTGVMGGRITTALANPGMGIANTFTIGDNAAAGTRSFQSGVMVLAGAPQFRLTLDGRYYDVGDPWGYESPTLELIGGALSQDNWELVVRPGVQYDGVAAANGLSLSGVTWTPLTRDITVYNLGDLAITGNNAIAAGRTVNVANTLYGSLTLGTVGTGNIAIGATAADIGRLLIGKDLLGNLNFLAIHNGDPGNNKALVQIGRNFGEGAEIDYSPFAGNDFYGDITVGGDWLGVLDINGTGTEIVRFGTSPYRGSSIRINGNFGSPTITGSLIDIENGRIYMDSVATANHGLRIGADGTGIMYGDVYAHALSNSTAYGTMSNNRIEIGTAASVAGQAWMAHTARLAADRMTMPNLVLYGGNAADVMRGQILSGTTTILLTGDTLGIRGTIDVRGGMAEQAEIRALQTQTRNTTGWLYVGGYEANTVFTHDVKGVIAAGDGYTTAAGGVAEEAYATFGRGFNLTATNATNNPDFTGVLRATGQGQYIGPDFQGVFNYGNIDIRGDMSGQMLGYFLPDIEICDVAGSVFSGTIEAYDRFLSGGVRIGQTNAGLIRAGGADMIYTSGTIASGGNVLSIPTAAGTLDITSDAANVVYSYLYSGAGDTIEAFRVDSGNVRSVVGTGVVLNSFFSEAGLNGGLSMIDMNDGVGDSALYSVRLQAFDLNDRIEVEGQLGQVGVQTGNFAGDIVTAVGGVGAIADLVGIIYNYDSATDFVADSTITIGGNVREYAGLLSLRHYQMTAPDAFHVLGNFSGAVYVSNTDFSGNITIDGNMTANARIRDDANAVVSGTTTIGGNMDGQFFFPATNPNLSGVINVGVDMTGTVYLGDANNDTGSTLSGTISIGRDMTETSRIYVYGAPGITGNVNVGRDIIRVGANYGRIYALNGPINGTIDVTGNVQGYIYAGDNANPATGDTIANLGGTIHIGGNLDGTLGAAYIGVCGLGGITTTGQIIIDGGMLGNANARIYDYNGPMDGLIDIGGDVSGNIYVGDNTNPASGTFDGNANLNGTIDVGGQLNGTSGQILIAGTSGITATGQVLVGGGMMTDSTRVIAYNGPVDGLIDVTGDMYGRIYVGNAEDATDASANLTGRIAISGAMITQGDVYIYGTGGITATGQLDVGGGLSADGARIYLYRGPMAGVMNIGGDMLGRIYMGDGDADTGTNLTGTLNITNAVTDPNVGGYIYVYGTGGITGSVTIDGDIADGRYLTAFEGPIAGTVNVGGNLIGRIQAGDNEGNDPTSNITGAITVGGTLGGGTESRIRSYGMGGITNTAVITVNGGILGGAGTTGGYIMTYNGPIAGTINVFGDMAGHIWAGNAAGDVAADLTGAINITNAGSDPNLNGEIQVWGIGGISGVINVDGNFDSTPGWDTWIRTSNASSDLTGAINIGGGIMGAAYIQIADDMAGAGAIAVGGAVQDTAYIQIGSDIRDTGSITVGGAVTSTVVTGGIDVNGSIVSTGPYSISVGGVGANASIQVYGSAASGAEMRILGLFDALGLVRVGENGAGTFGNVVVSTNPLSGGTFRGYDDNNNAILVTDSGTAGQLTYTRDRDLVSNNDPGTLFGGNAVVLNPGDTFVFTDSDGDTVTVTYDPLSTGTVAIATAAAGIGLDITNIQYSGATATSDLDIQVTVVVGNGVTTAGNVDAAGQVFGTFTVDGWVEGWTGGQLAAGETLTADDMTDLMTLEGDLAGALMLNTLLTGAIQVEGDVAVGGSITIGASGIRGGGLYLEGGDNNGTITVNGVGQTYVGGLLHGGRNVTGVSEDPNPLDTLSIAAADDVKIFWDGIHDVGYGVLYAGGAVTSIYATDSLDSIVTTGLNIGSIRVDGRVKAASGIVLSNGGVTNTSIGIDITNGNLDFLRLQRFDHPDYTVQVGGDLGTVWITEGMLEGTIRTVGAGSDLTGAITTATGQEIRGNITIAGNITSTGAIMPGGTTTPIAGEDITGLISVGGYMAGKIYAYDLGKDVANGYDAAGNPQVWPLKGRIEVTGNITGAIDIVDTMKDYSYISSQGFIASAAFSGTELTAGVRVQGLAGIGALPGRITTRISLSDPFSWSFGVDSGVTTRAFEVLADLNYWYDYSLTLDGRNLAPAGWTLESPTISSPTSQTLAVWKGVLNGIRYAGTDHSVTPLASLGSAIFTDYTTGADTLTVLNAGNLTMTATAAAMGAGDVMDVRNVVWGKVDLGANAMNGLIDIVGNLVYDRDNGSDGWISSTGRIADYSGAAGIRVQGLAGAGVLGGRITTALATPGLGVANTFTIGDDAAAGTRSLTTAVMAFAGAPTFRLTLDGRFGTTAGWTLESPTLSLYGGALTESEWETTIRTSGNVQYDGVSAADGLSFESSVAGSTFDVLNNDVTFFNLGNISITGNNAIGAGRTLNVSNTLYGTATIGTLADNNIAMADTARIMIGQDLLGNLNFVAQLYGTGAAGPIINKALISIGRNFAEGAEIDYTPYAGDDFFGDITVGGDWLGVLDVNGTNTDFGRFGVSGAYGGTKITINGNFGSPTVTGALIDVENGRWYSDSITNGATMAGLHIGADAGAGAAGGTGIMYGDLSIRAQGNATDRGTLSSTRINVGTLADSTAGEAYVAHTAKIAVDRYSAPGFYVYGGDLVDVFQGQYLTGLSSYATGDTVGLQGTVYIYGGMSEQAEIRTLRVHDSVNNAQMYYGGVGAGFTFRNDVNGAIAVGDGYNSDDDGDGVNDEALATFGRAFVLDATLAATLPDFSGVIRTFGQGIVGGQFEGVFSYGDINIIGDVSGEMLGYYLPDLEFTGAARTFSGAIDVYEAFRGGGLYIAGTTAGSIRVGGVDQTYYTGLAGVGESVTITTPNGNTLVWTSNTANARYSYLYSAGSGDAIHMFRVEGGAGTQSLVGSGVKLGSFYTENTLAGGTSAIDMNDSGVYDSALYSVRLSTFPTAASIAVEGELGQVVVSGGAFQGDITTTVGPVLGSADLSGLITTYSDASDFDSNSQISIAGNGRLRSGLISLQHMTGNSFETLGDMNGLIYAATNSDVLDPPLTPIIHIGGDMNNRIIFPGTYAPFGGSIAIDGDLNSQIYIGDATTDTGTNLTGSITIGGAMNNAEIRTYGAIGISGAITVTGALTGTSFIRGYRGDLLTTGGGYSISVGGMEAGTLIQIYGTAAAADEIRVLGEFDGTVRVGENAVGVFGNVEIASNAGSTGTFRAYNRNAAAVLNDNDGGATASQLTYVRDVDAVTSSVKSTLFAFDNSQVVNPGVPYVFTDRDGDVVTVTYTGPGGSSVVLDMVDAGAGRQDIGYITYAGAVDATSNLTIDTNGAGGNATSGGGVTATGFTFGSFSIEGWVDSWVGGTLAGGETIDITGNLGRASFENNVSGDLTVGGDVSGPVSIVGDLAGDIDITGALASTITIDGAGGVTAAGSITVGDMPTSASRITTTVGPMAGAITVNNTLRGYIYVGDADADTTADLSGDIHIVGDMADNGRILIRGTGGITGSGSIDVDGGLTNGTGTLIYAYNGPIDGTVNVDGDLTGYIYAGYNASDTNGNITGSVTVGSMSGAARIRHWGTGAMSGTISVTGDVVGTGYIIVGPDTVTGTVSGTISVGGNLGTAAGADTAYIRAVNLSGAGAINVTGDIQASSYIYIAGSMADTSSVSVGGITSARAAGAIDIDGSVGVNSDIFINGDMDGVIDIDGSVSGEIDITGTMNSSAAFIDVQGTLASATFIGNDLQTGLRIQGLDGGGADNVLVGRVRTATDLSGAVNWSIGDDTDSNLRTFTYTGVPSIGGTAWLTLDGRYLAAAGWQRESPTLTITNAVTLADLNNVIAGIGYDGAAGTFVSVNGVTLSDFNVGATGTLTLLNSGALTITEAAGMGDSDLLTVENKVYGAIYVQNGNVATAAMSGTSGIVVNSDIVAGGQVRLQGLLNSTLATGTIHVVGDVYGDIRVDADDGTFSSADNSRIYVDGALRGSGQIYFSDASDPRYCRTDIEVDGGILENSRIYIAHRARNAYITTGPVTSTRSGGAIYTGYLYEVLTINGNVGAGTDINLGSGMLTSATNGQVVVNGNVEAGGVIRTSYIATTGGGDEIYVSGDMAGEIRITGANSSTAAAPYSLIAGGSINVVGDLTGMINFTYATHDGGVVRGNIIVGGDIAGTGGIFVNRADVASTSAITVGGNVTSTRADGAIDLGRDFLGSISIGDLASGSSIQVFGTAASSVMNVLGEFDGLIYVGQGGAGSLVPGRFGNVFVATNAGSNGTFRAYDDNNSALLYTDDTTAGQLTYTRDIDGVSNNNRDTLFYIAPVLNPGGSYVFTDDNGDEVTVTYDPLSTGTVTLFMVQAGVGENLAYATYSGATASSGLTVLVTNPLGDGVTTVGTVVGTGQVFGSFTVDGSVNTWTGGELAAGETITISNNLGAGSLEGDLAGNLSVGGNANGALSIAGDLSGTIAITGTLASTLTINGAGGVTGAGSITVGDMPTTASQIITSQGPMNGAITVNNALRGYIYVGDADADITADLGGDIHIVGDMAGDGRILIRGQGGITGAGSIDVDGALTNGANTQIYVLNGPVAAGGLINIDCNGGATDMTGYIYVGNADADTTADLAGTVHVGGNMSGNGRILIRGTGGITGTGLIDVDGTMVGASALIYTYNGPVAAGGMIDVNCGLGITDMSGYIYVGDADADTTADLAGTIHVGGNMSGNGRILIRGQGGVTNTGLIDVDGNMVGATNLIYTYNGPMDGAIDVTGGMNGYIYVGNTTSDANANLNGDISIGGQMGSAGRIYIYGTGGVTPTGSITIAGGMALGTTANERIITAQGPMDGLVEIGADMNGYIFIGDATADTNANLTGQIRITNLVTDPNMGGYIRVYGQGGISGTILVDGDFVGGGTGITYINTYGAGADLTGLISIGGRIGGDAYIRANDDISGGGSIAVGGTLDDTAYIQVADDIRDTGSITVGGAVTGTRAAGAIDVDGSVLSTGSYSISVGGVGAGASIQVRESAATGAEMRILGDLLGLVRVGEDGRGTFGNVVLATSLASNGTFRGYDDNNSALLITDSVTAGQLTYTRDRDAYSDNNPATLFAGQGSAVVLNPGDPAFNYTDSDGDTVAATYAGGGTGTATLYFLPAGLGQDIFSIVYAGATATSDLDIQVTVVVGNGVTTAGNVDAAGQVFGTFTVDGWIEGWTGGQLGAGETLTADDMTGLMTLEGDLAGALTLNTLLTGAIQVEGDVAVGGSITIGASGIRGGGLCLEGGDNNGTITVNGVGQTYVGGFLHGGLNTTGTPIAPNPLDTLSIVAANDVQIFWDGIHEAGYGVLYAGGAVTSIYATDSINSIVTTALAVGSIRVDGRVTAVPTLSALDMRVSDGTFTSTGYGIDITGAGAALNYLRLQNFDHPDYQVRVAGNLGTVWITEGMLEGAITTTTGGNLTGVISTAPGQEIRGNITINGAMLAGSAIMPGGDTTLTAGEDITGTIAVAGAGGIAGMIYCYDLGKDITNENGDVYSLPGVIRATNANGAITGGIDIFNVMADYSYIESGTTAAIANAVINGDLTLASGVRVQGLAGTGALAGRITTYLNTLNANRTFTFADGPGLADLRTFSFAATAIANTARLTLDGRNLDASWTLESPSLTINGNISAANLNTVLAAITYDGVLNSTVNGNPNVLASIYSATINNWGGAAANTVTVLNVGTLTCSTAGQGIAAGDVLNVENVVWGRIDLGAVGLLGLIDIDNNLVYDIDNGSDGQIQTTGTATLASYAGGAAGIRVSGLGAAGVLGGRITTYYNNLDAVRSFTIGEGGANLRRFDTIDLNLTHTFQLVLDGRYGTTAGWAVESPTLVRVGGLLTAAEWETIRTSAGTTYRWNNLASGGAASNGLSLSGCTGANSFTTLPVGFTVFNMGDVRFTNAAPVAVGQTLTILNDLWGTLTIGDAQTANFLLAGTIDINGDLRGNLNFTGRVDYTGLIDIAGDFAAGAEIDYTPGNSRDWLGDITIGGDWLGLLDINGSDTDLYRVTAPADAPLFTINGNFGSPKVTGALIDVAAGDIYTDYGTRGIRVGADGTGIMYGDILVHSGSDTSRGYIYGWTVTIGLNGYVGPGYAYMDHASRIVAERWYASTTNIYNQDRAEGLDGQILAATRNTVYGLNIGINAGMTIRGGMGEQGEVRALGSIRRDGNPQMMQYCGFTGGLTFYNDVLGAIAVGDGYVSSGFGMFATEENATFGQGFALTVNGAGSEFGGVLRSTGMGRYNGPDFQGVFNYGDITLAGDVTGDIVGYFLPDIETTTATVSFTGRIEAFDRFLGGALRFQNPDAWLDGVVRVDGSDMNYYSGTLTAASPTLTINTPGGGVLTMTRAAADIPYQYLYDGVSDRVTALRIEGTPAVQSIVGTGVVVDSFYSEGDLAAGGFIDLNDDLANGLDTALYSVRLRFLRDLTTSISVEGDLGQVVANDDDAANPPEEGLRSNISSTVGAVGASADLMGLILTRYGAIYGGTISIGQDVRENGGLYSPTSIGRNADTYVDVDIAGDMNGLILAYDQIRAGTGATKTTINIGGSVGDTAEIRSWNSVPYDAAMIVGGNFGGRFYIGDSITGDPLATFLGSLDIGGVMTNAAYFYIFGNTTAGNGSSLASATFVGPNLATGIRIQGLNDTGDILGRLRYRINLDADVSVDIGDWNTTTNLRNLTILDQNYLNGGNAVFMDLDGWFVPTAGAWQNETPGLDLNTQATVPVTLAQLNTLLNAINYDGTQHGPTTLASVSNVTLSDFATGGDGTLNIVNCRELRIYEALGNNDAITIVNAVTGTLQVNNAAGTYQDIAGNAAVSVGGDITGGAIRFGNLTSAAPVGIYVGGGLRNNPFVYNSLGGYMQAYGVTGVSGVIDIDGGMSGNSYIILSNAAADLSGTLDIGGSIQDQAYIQIADEINGAGQILIGGDVTSTRAAGAIDINDGISALGGTRISITGSLAGIIDITNQIQNNCTVQIGGNLSGSLLANLMGNVTVVGSFSGTIGRAATANGVGNTLNVGIPGGGGALVPGPAIFAAIIGWP